MVKVERSALVTYSASQMFELVNDFERYPEYMPGCVGAELVDSGEGWLKGRLHLSKAGIKQSFVTFNRLTPPTKMTLELEEGPFKQLQGAWEFTPLREDACKVSFYLEFEFANKLVAAVASKMMEAVASEQLNCVCLRAKSIYGH